MPEESLQTTGMWDCPPCRCGYGTYAKTQDDCEPCDPPANSHKVPVPTALADCASPDG